MRFCVRTTAITIGLMWGFVFFAVAGGDGAEPGSGERLALRQVSAVLEARGQGFALARAAQLETIATELQEAGAQQARSHRNGGEVTDPAEDGTA